MVKSTTRRGVQRICRAYTRRMDGRTPWDQRDWGQGFDLSSSEAKRRPLGLMHLATDEA